MKTEEGMQVAGCAMAAPAEGGQQSTLAHGASSSLCFGLIVLFLQDTARHLVYGWCICVLIAASVGLLAGGMSGSLVPPDGEVCPPVVAPPFRSLGDDIASNATCSALFLNPPHQKHITRPLPGQGFEVSCGKD